MAYRCFGYVLLLGVDKNLLVFLTVTNHYAYASQTRLKKKKKNITRRYNEKYATSRVLEIEAYY